MGNILRGLVLVVFFAIYTMMVYFKGIGEASHVLLAWLFALNVYFFIPLKVASRIDGDEGNFFEVIGEGRSEDHLDGILIGLGILIAFMFVSIIGGAYMNTYNPGGIDLVIGLVIGAVGIIGMFFLASIWYGMNLQALVVYKDGNIFDKVGMFVSYVCLIAFVTAETVNCSTGCGIWKIAGASFFIMLIFSPAIGSLFGGGSDSDVGPAVLFLFYILAYALNIPAVHFTFTIEPEIIHMFSIVVSIPGMFVLARIITSIVIRNKMINNMVTLGFVSLFYGVVFYQVGSI